MKNFNPVRGTYDYPPRQARFREAVRQAILNNYLSNGFHLIETPILEHLENLNSSEGGDNLRLMFKTIKRADKLDLTKPDLTEADIVSEGLRYDLTVPLARFYSNNREALPSPFKSIQIGYSFRAERPQKGRNRQFVQCDVDILGDETINAELEILDTVLSTYQQLGLKNLTLRINSKKILNTLVLAAGFEPADVDAVCKTLDKLDKISINGVIMELIENQFAIDSINRLVDIINEVQSGGLDVTKNFGVEQDTISDLHYLIDTLNTLHPSVKVMFDVSIVRGQGYYTGTVYEVFTEGFGGALGGGGRYDNMVEKFSGIKVPAVGFGMGFEPVCMMCEQNTSGIKGWKPNLALIYEPTDDIKEVFATKHNLQQEYNVSLYQRKKNMKNFYDKLSQTTDYATTLAEVKAGAAPKALIHN